ncbi:hypothetical protein D3C73_899670 [compost metagenome]
MVMQFITFFQASQDSDGVFNAGFRHIDFLETTFERRVFLYILAIFVQRGGTDAVQFPTCQRRFQHIAGIHCAIGFTRADHSVQFINKQNDAAFLFGQIAQHRFQTLFKFTAVLGPGNQRPHIEGQHSFML